MKDRGPSKENFEKKFTRQSKLGWGPNKKKCDKHFREQRKLGWAQQREMYQAFQKDIIFDKYLNDVWQFKIKLKQI